MLAGTFAEVPLVISMAGRTEISLAFIGAAVLFLPLFVFLPKLIQRALKADTDAVIEAFGKNEQVKSLLDLLHLNGRAGPGPGRGPGDGAADCGVDHGDCVRYEISLLTPILF